MKRLSICVAALLASPVVAQDGATEPADAADAISACTSITESDWLHLKRLPSVGWDAAKRRGARSMRVIKGVYEKENNSALIVIGTEQLDTKSCVVQAFLSDTGNYGTFLQEVSGIVGMPSGQEGYTYHWQMDSHRLRVDPAGDKKRPIARFEITAIPQESAE